MRAIVTIQHPGHVHFFKHAIRELQSQGHELHVFARENEVTVELLERAGIDHEVLAGESNSLFSLAAVQATYETRLLRRARRIGPDVITAIGGVAAAHVASVVGAKSVVFYDTEHATIITKLAYTLADVVCTPECYQGDIGSKHRTYPGYHELAYLHPDRFEPDPAVLADAGLEPDDTLVVMRLSSWDSSHDVGQGGFDDPVDVVERLAELVRFFHDTRRSLRPIDGCNDYHTVRTRPRDIKGSSRPTGQELAPRDGSSARSASARDVRDRENAGRCDRRGRRSPTSEDGAFDRNIYDIAT
jgi:predicted glycosyltransferase